MLLLDVSHTSHTRAQTGIQRVTRALASALAALGETTPVCYDPYLDGWRRLNSAESECLGERTRAPGRSRGARWTWGQKIAGHSKRIARRRPTPPAGSGLICPELFSPKVAARLPELFARITGSRIAIFHDAIALKFPELTPPATVARMPAYLRELAMFDGVAAVSEDSAQSLRDFWEWAGVKSPPPVRAVPLGLDARDDSVSGSAPTAARVLCVSTIEGRKNHVALLEAAEQLWREGLQFELELVGLARPDTAAAALAKTESLKSAGRPVRLHGAVNDHDLQAAYARSRFTVYPSLLEGFGMPVLESLQHGKPCICSARGALGESARGGGCLVLEKMGASEIAGAMRRLLTNPAELAALAAQARTRHFRTWTEYARDLTNWSATLSRRT